MDAVPPRQMLWIVFIVFMLLAMITTCIHQSAIVIGDARLKKLAEDGNKKAKKLEKLLDGGSSAFAGAMQFISTLILIVCGICSQLLFREPLTSALMRSGISAGVSFWLAFAIIVLMTALVYLVFGVFVPKGYAGKHAEGIALTSASLAVLLTYVCMPFVCLPGVVSKIVLRILGVKPGENDEDVTEEEIRMMVDIGSESGVIDDDEKEMIHNIFELDDKPVEDIMTHRTDAVILWINDGADKWEEVINETNHTRYPVCGNAIDDILGVVNSRDFYKFLIKDRNGDLRSILRKPYFVPESLKADEMFSQMQDKNAHFAIVLDEYGGFRGIITQEDLIEEIVGELYSEYDRPEEDLDIIQMSDDTWLIYGSADIDDVRDELGVDIPDDEYNTFAGLLLDELGTVPADGETPELTVGRMKVNITKITEHRIEETVVTLLPKSDDDEAAEFDGSNDKNKSSEDAKEKD